jgi:hypothetical protein
MNVYVREVKEALIKASTLKTAKAMFPETSEHQNLTRLILEKQRYTLLSSRENFWIKRNCSAAFEDRRIF